MKYAVIKTGGKQYRVSEGDVIEVDRLSKDSGNLLFDQVLLTVIDDNVKIGNPIISGEKVSASFVENVKGDKIRVSKFKSKVRFRKTTGFRASLSKVKIEKIGQAKSSK